MDEDEEPGGETTCFLPSLDATGAMPDVRRLIRLAGQGDDRDGWTVLVGRERTDFGQFDEWLPDLAPRPGEGCDDYLARLNQPAGRTSAWRVVLRAQEEPVRIIPGPDVPEAHAKLLLAYLHDLAR